MNVFNFYLPEIIASLVVIFVFGIFFGFLIGLIRYMMIGVFERKI